MLKWQRMNRSYLPSSGQPRAKFEYLQKLTSRIRWGAVSRSTVGRVSRPTPRRVYRVSDVINRALQLPVQSRDRGSYKKKYDNPPWSVAIFISCRARKDGGGTCDTRIYYIHTCRSRQVLCR